MDYSVGIYPSLRYIGTLVSLCWNVRLQSLVNIAIYDNYWTGTSLANSSLDNLQIGNNKSFSLSIINIMRLSCLAIKLKMICVN